MTDRTLLDAIDALTKPVARAMIVDANHEHDWQPVVTPPGTPSPSAAKADWIAWTVSCGGDPAGKTKQQLIDEFGNPEPITAAWSCQYCDIVTDLPLRRPLKPVTARRTDDSLLDQIQESVASDLGQSGGKQQGREQVPIDVGALQIVADIRDTLYVWLDDLGAKPRGVSLAQMLRSWYILTLSGHDDHSHRIGTLDKWANRIRRHLDPPITSEVQEICPRCEFAYALVDGIRSRALRGTNGATWDSTSVECQVCGQEWKGEEQLRQLANATRRLSGAEERTSPPIAVSE